MACHLSSYVSSPTARHLGLWLAIGCLAGSLLMLAVGCQPAKPEPVETEESAPKASSAGVHLRVAVVGDPALVTAIEQLRGEWNAQTESTLSVESVPLTDPPKVPAADVIVAPAYYLPVLAEETRIQGAPRHLIESGETGWGEVFTVLRSHEVVWRGGTVAIPFGSPVLTCYYRRDLLEKLSLRPPRTWAEYQRVAKTLADRQRVGTHDAAWCGAMEPLGKGWAGIVLLARAAPYATHPSNYSTLFKIETMEPLIAGPPFVRALEELVATAKTDPANLKTLEADPTAVRRAFWEGHCGMALCWPTAAEKLTVPDESPIRVGFVEMPGSVDVYDITTQAWQKRPRDDDPRVPLVSIAGRLGMVDVECPRPEVAFRLLVWLSDRQRAGQISATSSATTLFRLTGSITEKAWAKTWVEPVMPADAALEYSELTQKTLCRQHMLFALRIPGRARYLAALDDAVHDAIRGKKTPLEALQQAATRWQEITQQLGQQRQATAYRRGLGME